MLSEMLATPVRPWTSWMVTGRDLLPSAVPAPTVALYENVPSPVVTSPLVPSSNIVCDALPPIGVRSAMAVMPVLAGDWPGVTATLSSVMPVAETVDGVAEPAPTRPPQLHAVVALLRGLTAPVVKSVLLWSVSVQPLSMRDTLSVALGVPVAVPPSLQLAVDP